VSIFQEFNILTQSSCGSGVNVGTVEIKVDGLERFDVNGIVGIQGIRAHFYLLSVRETVAVGIGVVRVGSVDINLVVVREPVAVTVGVKGIGAVDKYFVTVGESVAVGVGIEGVGAVNKHFVAVGQPVTIGIGNQRVGAVLVEFLSVGQPVTVGVGVERIRADLQFDMIGYPSPSESSVRSSTTSSVVRHPPSIIAAPNTKSMANVANIWMFHRNSPV
jgi:hypothetical protein